MIKTCWMIGSLHNINARSRTATDLTRDYLVARQASWSRHLQAGSDGRTDPLRHQRLGIDSPSRAALKTCTAGPWELVGQWYPRPERSLRAVRCLGAKMCWRRSD
jgi:hypothetical protein